MRVRVIVGGLGVVLALVVVMLLASSPGERAPARSAGVETLSVVPTERERESFAAWRPVIRTERVTSGLVLDGTTGEPAAVALLLGDGREVVLERGQFRVTEDPPFSIVGLRGAAYVDFGRDGRGRIDVLAPVRGIELHLSPRSPIDLEPGGGLTRVIGRVRSASSLPIEIEVEPLDGFDDPIARVRVNDDNGRFALNVRRTGPLRLVALQGNAVAVARAGRNALLELGPASPLDVRISGPEHAGPTHVALEWIGEQTRRTLHERIVYGNTQFLSFAHVGLGRFRVSLQRADGYSARGEVIREDGARRELRLSWKTGATVTGLLTDARGAPVAGAVVQLFESDRFALAPPTPMTVSGADGAFALRGIPEGEHAFVVTAAGFEPRVTERRTSTGMGELKPLMIRLNSVRFVRARPEASAGIGAELEPRVYELRVAAVAEGGGAHEAGLRPGDRLVAVEGQPVSEIGYRRSLDRLRGVDGTAVEIEVRPVGATATAIIRVERRDGFLDRLR